LLLLNKIYALIQSGHFIPVSENKTICKAIGLFFSIAFVFSNILLLVGSLKYETEKVLGLAFAKEKCFFAGK
jgi:hypothetical protein